MKEKLVHKAGGGDLLKNAHTICFTSIYNSYKPDYKRNTMFVSSK